MKYLLNLEVINKFILGDSNSKISLEAVSNLAIAVLSTLGVLCKFGEAIQLIEELLAVMVYFKQDHLKFHIIYANLLYQDLRIKSQDPEQNNHVNEKLQQIRIILKRV